VPRRMKLLLPRSGCASWRRFEDHTDRTLIRSLELGDLIVALARDDLIVWFAICSYVKSWRPRWSVPCRDHLCPSGACCTDRECPRSRPAAPAVGQLWRAAREAWLYLVGLSSNGLPCRYASCNLEVNAEAPRRLLIVSDNEVRAPRYRFPAALPRRLRCNPPPEQSCNDHRG